MSNTNKPVTRTIYNTTQVSKILGVTFEMVTQYIRHGKLAATKEGRSWKIRRADLLDFIQHYYHPDQLCETCQHACGGCSWSDDFMPVEGWTAVPTKINTGREDRVSVPSFEISSCPMYIADGPKHTTKMTDDGLYRLLHAMLLALVRDYAYAVKKNNIRAMRETERYVTLPMFDEILGVLKLDANGPNLLDVIRADPLGVIERIRNLNTEKGNDNDDDYNQ